MKSGLNFFLRRFRENHNEFDEKKIKKLAMENARYLISIFTPATEMEYTVNFCQLNYILGWMKDYIKDEPNTDFSAKLKDVFKEFIDEMPDLEVEGLESGMKNRGFSLFAKRGSQRRIW